MAVKVIEVDLLTTDSTGSIKKRTADAKGLNKELEKSKVLATGTKTGAAAAYRASAAVEDTTYNKQRGAAGVTGAAGRDFANQAQGLGGVVRLYATYAANLFAVGAAYRALSEAQNTSNMVQGLNQIGASSGVALGSLAKDFAKASGGAISLRESMEATAKAMSSGMSQSQFIKLGEVAKKASQALGVNMSDAVSRLTRGITKLEPELLDELGIFTKVGKATEDYAKSVGKSASSLTDFERRQAFANAVLAEGVSKFSEINIPTNPYDMLVASLKDVATTGLQVINTVLVPITSMLASSPTVLTGVLAGLGTMLLKSAMPAIGQYRKELEAAASYSASIAQSKADTALSIEKNMYEEIRQQAEAAADVEHEAMGRTEDMLRKKQGSFRASSAAYKILQKDITEMEEADASFFDKRAKRLASQGNMDMSKLYKDTATHIRSAKAAEEEYGRVVKANTEALTARQNSISNAMGRAQIIAKRAADTASSKGIISRSASDTEIVGMTTAWANVQKDLSDKKLGPIRTGFTRIASAATIATTAATSFISAISTGLFVIGAVAAGLALLYSWLQGNGKEMKAFNESMDSLNNTTETAALTLKKFSNDNSIDALVAQATTVDGMAVSMNALVSSLAAADSAANGLDKFVDGFKSVVDMGLKDEFAKQIPEAVRVGIANIRDPKLKQEAEESLKSIFGTTNITKDLIEDMNPAELIAGFTKFGKVMDILGKKSIAAAAPLTDIKTGFKDLDTKFQSLKNTLANKDETSQFAVSLIAQSSKMQEAFKTTEGTAAVLLEVMKDTAQIRMFPPETQASILQAAKEMAGFQAAVVAASNELAMAENKVREFTSAANSATNPAVKEIIVTMRVRAEGDLAAASTKLNAATANVNKLTSGISAGMSQATVSAFKALEQPFIAAVAKAGIDSSKAAVGLLEKTPETVRRQTQLEMQSISVQASQIKATYNLTAQLELSRLSAERLSLEERKLKAVDNGDRKDIDVLSAEIAKIVNQERAYKSNNPFKDVREGKLQGSPEVAGILSQRVGLDTKLAELAGQLDVIKLTGKANEELAKLGEIEKQRKDALATAIGRQAQEKNGTAYLNASPEDRARMEFNWEDEIRSLNDRITNLDIEAIKRKADVVMRFASSSTERGLGAKGLEVANADLEKRESLQRDAQVQAKIANERKILLDINTRYLAQTEAQISASETLRTVEVETSSIISDLYRTQLDKKLALGEITELQHTNMVTQMEITALTKEYDTKVTEINNKAMLEGIAISKEYTAAGYVMTSSILERIRANEDSTKAELSGAEAVYQARLKGKDLFTEMEARQKAYGEVFKSSFEGMADAMVEFAKTGKLDFKEMINSMLADLLRYEMRANMMKAYQGFGGSNGIAGAITSMFSGGTATGSSGNSAAGFELDWNSMTSAIMANGGAFDGGVQKFAKGGSFTNSIVDAPTAFNVGLMGEAGPEAIMPLKRTSNGALGIQASGGSTNVQVAVINNSGAPAETRETTDSKGNRKIEVIIGEMVSAEMSRPNSPVQNTMKNTFGSKPMLTRR